MTATEASRNFAALLEEVQRGQTVVITRGGTRIASMGPATVGNGADVIALLTSAAADPGFADDVHSARDAVVIEQPGVARRLILDTGVLVSSERSRSRSGPASALADDDDVVIAAITSPPRRHMRACWHMAIAAGPDKEPTTSSSRPRHW